MTKESEKLYFYCEPCGFKKIVEGKEHGMVEIKTSPVPLAPPKVEDLKDKKKYKKNTYKLNEETRENIAPNTRNQSLKVKCPKCGRGVTAKALVGAFTKAYELKEESEKAQKQLSEKKQRLLDGLPDKKRTAVEQQFDNMVGKYLPKEKLNTASLAEFEKMIDALVQNKVKNDGQGNDPRHQGGSAGREVSEDTTRESGG